MKKYILPALRLFLIITVLTGVIYPLAITLIANGLYPDKAKGSLVIKDGKITGSELIGQKFTSEKYFWGRPSSIDNNPMPSGGSNLGPTSKALLDQVNARKDTLIKYHGNKLPIPKDLLFASASGVDPDISPEAAVYQIERIAKARNFSEDQKTKLYKLVKQFSIHPQFEFLGMPRVNVFMLNLALDKLN